MFLLQFASQNPRSWPAVHDLGAAKRGTCVLGIFQEAGFAARASGPFAANLALSPSSTAPGPWLNGSRLPSQGPCAAALGVHASRAARHASPTARSLDWVCLKDYRCQTYRYRLLL